jgi:hypothetical protein
MDMFFEMFGCPFNVMKGCNSFPSLNVVVAVAFGRCQDGGKDLPYSLFLNVRQLQRIRKGACTRHR